MAIGKRFTIIIKDKMKKEIEDTAKRLDMTPSELSREAILVYLNKNKAKGKK